MVNMNKVLIDVATYTIREGTPFKMCPDFRITIFGANVLTK
jgi:hypothetical protein